MGSEKRHTALLTSTASAANRELTAEPPDRVTPVVRKRSDGLHPTPDRHFCEEVRRVIDQVRQQQTMRP
ncbi:MAG: hypothetical protein R6X15_08130 [Pseudomonadota bacterium]